MLKRESTILPFGIWVSGILMIVLFETPYLMIDMAIVLATFIFINICMSIPAVSRLRIIFMTILALAVDLAFGANSTFVARFIGASFAYFVVDILLLIKYGERLRIVFLLATAPILLLYSIVAPDVETSQLPLAFTPLVGLAFATIGSKTWGRWVPFSFVLIGLFITTVVGFPNYRSFLFGKKFNTLDDRSMLTLIDRNGETLKIDDIKSKVIVLDFWFSGCGVCFKEFPAYENLAKKYRENDVFFATVFVPYQEKEEKSDTWYYAVNDYDLNHFRASDNMASNKWRIHGYPQILIFDHAKKLRYQGSLNQNTFINNPYLIIKSLLKEAPSSKKEIATNASTLQN